MKGYHVRIKINFSYPMRAYFIKCANEETR